MLLADEPTGNLDPKTADHVFDTLAELVKASRVAALIATHNLDLAARMDRRVTLREGSGGDGVGAGWAPAVAGRVPPSTPTAVPRLSVAMSGAA